MEVAPRRGHEDTLGRHKLRSSRFDSQFYESSQGIPLIEMPMFADRYSRFRVLGKEGGQRELMARKSALYPFSSFRALFERV